jgi:hypothetical protein
MGDEHIDRLKLPNNHFESTVSKLDSSLNSSCEQGEADTASIRSTKAVQARRVVPDLMRNRATLMVEFVRYAGQQRNVDIKTKRPLAAVLANGRCGCAVSDVSKSPTTP